MCRAASSSSLVALPIPNQTKPKGGRKSEPKNTRNPEGPSNGSEVGKEGGEIDKVGMQPGKARNPRNPSDCEMEEERGLNGSEKLTLTDTKNPQRMDDGDADLEEESGATT